MLVDMIPGTEFSFIFRQVCASPDGLQTSLAPRPPVSRYTQKYTHGRFLTTFEIRANETPAYRTVRVGFLGTFRWCGGVFRVLSRFDSTFWLDISCWFLCDFSAWWCPKVGL